MSDVERAPEVVVRVHVERMSDGSYCALDASDTLLAQGEDFVDLRTNLDEVIANAHGDRARAVLVVGKQAVNLG
jgi:hypothetical protein